MASNVAASMKASIIIDKKEIISSALSAYAEAQKEIAGNKIELLVDVSDDKARERLKEISKELAGKDYVIKFKNQGIEETMKSLDELFGRIKDVINLSNGININPINLDTNIHALQQEEAELKKVTDSYEKLLDLKHKIKNVNKSSYSGKHNTDWIGIYSSQEEAITNELADNKQKLHSSINLILSEDKNALSALEEEANRLKTALQSVQDMVNRISSNSSLSHLDENKGSEEWYKGYAEAYKAIDDRLAELHSQYRLTNEELEEYVTLQIKAEKIMEKMVSHNGGVQASGASSKAELKSWIEKSFARDLGLNPDDIYDGLFGNITDAMYGSGIGISLFDAEGAKRNLRELSAEVLKYKSATSVFDGAFGANEDAERLREISSVLTYIEKNMSEIESTDFSAQIKQATDNVEYFSKKLAEGEHTDFYSEALEKAQKELQELIELQERLNVAKRQDTDVIQTPASNAVEQLEKQEQQALATAQAEEKLAETEKNLGKSASTVDDSKFDELKADVTEIREELNGVKEKISAIDSEGFEHVKADVEKTVESVKELNSELTEVKSKLDSTSTSPVETNISSPIKDTFQGDKIEQATTSAKELDKTLEAVEIPKESFDEVISKFNIIEEKAKNIVKITKDMHRDSDGKPIESYNVTYKDGSNESYGESSNPQLLRSKDVLYDAKESEKKAQAEQKVAEAMAKGREQSEKARQSEQKRQELAQNKAINKALEQEYQERQKVAEASRKQAELDKQNALAFTKSASERLSSAISKYSYGDASDATAMMKQMNRGLSNFGDLSNIQGNIEKLSSSVDKVISDLQLSHEQSLSALKQEIKEEEVLQSQKDAFHKKNLNAIDMEIKKREEESSAYAKTLKSQMEERYNAISSMEKSLDNYNSKLEKFSVKPADGNRYPVYQQQIDNLTKKIGELDTLKNNLSKKDIIDESDMKSVNTLQREIDELILKMNNMSAGERGFDPLGADKALEKINSELKKNSAMSKEAKRQIQGFYDEIRSGNPSKPIKDLLDDMYKLIQAERLAGREGKSFMDIFKEKVVYGAAANMAGMIGIYDVINVFIQGFETIKEYDKALTEMNKVSNESIEILKEFQQESFEVADSIGATASAIQNSTADWMKLGYSLKDSAELSEWANIYANVGDMEIDEATEHMVSSVKAWSSEFANDIEASEAIVDRYNHIGNSYAITSADIGEAMETSAAALKAGGNSLNESLGLIVSGNLIQQDASTTASALKILSLRVRGAKADLEEMGETTEGLADSSSKMREEIQALTGVDIMLDEDTFKSTAQIIKEIGAVWDSMSDVSQAATLEKIAGIIFCLKFVETHIYRTHLTALIA